jgi:hypothetical protein
MWIFTDNGFVSAIRFDNSKPEITVRARDKKSLGELIDRTGAEIVVLNGTDYPYRLIIDETEWSSYVADKAMSIDYSNFKNRVYQTRGRDFAHLLSEVWGVMLEAERLEWEETTGEKMSSRDWFTEHKH